MTNDERKKHTMRRSNGFLIWIVFRFGDLE
jgi:hypothetical protein